MSAIVEALERSRTLDRPAAIVCQTKKGKGVSAMEGRFGFHGKPPSPELAEEALEELEAGSSGRRRRCCATGAGLMAAAEAKTEPIATRARLRRRAASTLGEEHDEVVALDADLAVSTQSVEVRQAVPRPLLQLRRRRGEHDVDGLRAGRDRQGPYASTFAIFASGRAYDQVRLGIAHNELKVRIGASHGGVSLGEDGASHQMIEDIALMRAMPRMQVVVPADYNQAYRAVLDSYEANDEPMYMRFGRPATPIVYDEIPETLGERRRRRPRGQGHHA